ncbi:MAG: lytic transglycosylase domain-containing protein [Clostridia bacterium]|nr:lytic transglycosylase domain-containing protein [Clostridia bacterium]
MRSTRKNMNGMGMGKLIIILLAISVVFGFVFDFVVTKIERAIYPKPSEYAEYVSRYSSEYGVPEELVWAVIKTESDFKASAVSGVGAVGLMQLMPDTFNEITNFRLNERLDAGMRYDPETNIRYGTYYLSYLYARYENWSTAIAAYNAGLGKVDEWLENDDYATDNTLTYIPYKETRNYVQKVQKALQMYEDLY